MKAFSIPADLTFSLKQVFQRAAVLLFLTAGFVCLIGPSAVGQEKSYPGLDYDLGIAYLRDAKLGDAREQFESGFRGGFKIATERWIDSICYAAMLGEAQYQLGQLPQALESFNTAILLAIQHSDWLTKVQNPPNPGAFNVKPVPWGDANPTRGLMNIPEKFSIMFGDLNSGNTYRTGGVVMPASLKQIRGAEIVRCTLLAIRRRAELLGDLGHGDELLAKLVTQLTKTQRSLAGSWFQAWVELELGVCHLALGKEDDGIHALTRCLTINGNAHYLTPVACVELGKLQMKAGSYEKAYNLFLEAATVAFYYEDTDMMQEAFTHLASAYTQRNLQMVCPPLLPAAQWAKVKDQTLFFASLQALRADDFLRFKQVGPAMEAVALAEGAIGKRTAALGRVGAEVNYLRARAAFLNPSPASQKLAAASLAKAMQFMQFGGTWNFQIQHTDLCLLNGLITPRKALESYQKLLGEPSPADWSMRPLEALSVTMTPRPGTWENYFLCAIEMERDEIALEISERARCAQFLQTLDFGGRMHSLRLILEAPEDDLTVQQHQRKRDILTEYPVYAANAKKIQTLQTEIRKMSLPVTQKEEETELLKKLKEVAELSRQQEALLSAIVLDRRPIDVVFPRVRTCKEIQQSLPKGEAMLVHYVARNQLFVFLLNNEKMGMWKIVDRGSGSGSSKKERVQGSVLTSLQMNFVSMLKEIGLGGSSIRPESFADSDWKTASQRVMADLTKNSPADFSKSDFTSLIVVPDRFTWYMPFEALQIQTPRGARPTIAQFAVRYSPMASLGTPWKKLQLPRSPYSMLVFGKKKPSSREEAQMEKLLERPVIFDEKSCGGIEPGSDGATSPYLAPVFDKMFVFADLKNTPGMSYTIFPMGVDYGSRNATLGHWFLLPYGAPRLVVLSGMQTQCESLIKNASRKSKKSVQTSVTPGMEFFLTSMAFLANGTDTVVLPRWNLEGSAAWRLMMQFEGQLPESQNSAAAWRKAVLKFAGNEIRIDQEPRIGKSDTVERVSCAHPFFWAGYVLIDSGSGSLRSLENLEQSIEAEENAGGGQELNVPRPLALPKREEDGEGEEAGEDEEAEEEAPARRNVPRASGQRRMPMGGAPPLE